MERKEEDKIISQWVTLNNYQHTLKLICLGLIALSITLMALTLTSRDKTPIVVKDIVGDMHYLVGSKKGVQIQKSNIERFIKQYIEFRYEWDGELRTERVIKNISPFITEGFKRKTTLFLKKLKEKDFKGQKLDQGHTEPKILVTDKSTTAIFDRILRINGTPLPIPTQVSFNLVKGERNYWNRLGLYINGVTIHEGK